MRILLTNDDGIDSEGIKTLAESLRSRGHKVYVIAPDKNRSGISHAVSLLNDPAKLTSLGEDIWACSGYPADCVIIGTMGLYQNKLDLVLSGINKGGNLGNDIIYSGTASAARQASLAGYPAIALSLVGNYGYNWDMAASWIADNLKELLSYWERNTFVNVNIPNEPGGPKGIAKARPAVKNYNDILHKENDSDGGILYSLAAGIETVSDEADNDYNTVSRNFVSVSQVQSYAVVCPCGEKKDWQ